MSGAKTCARPSKLWDNEVTRERAMLPALLACLAAVRERDHAAAWAAAGLAEDEPVIVHHDALPPHLFAHVRVARVGRRGCYDAPLR